MRGYFLPVLEYQVFFSKPLKQISQNFTPNCCSTNNYKTINSSDIAFLVSEDGLTFATLFNKQKHIVDYSIADLARQMDTSYFFQINRKIIVNIESVVKIHSWFNSRLKVEVNPPIGEDIIVSRERVKSFKEWLDK